MSFEHSYRQQLKSINKPTFYIQINMLLAVLGLKFVSQKLQNT